MELSQARDFVRANHHGILLTHRKDGSPQMSPIAVAIDAGGAAVISSRETAFKVQHLRRDPRASVCVLNDGFFGDWLQIDGTATIVSLPEAMEPLVEYYRSVSGEHPDWDEYRSAMERDRRVIIRIELERAGPDHHG